MTRATSRSEVKTQNLVMATYLTMIGFESRVVKAGATRSGRPLGAWVFDDSETLRGQMTLFESGHARVEPGAFNEALKQVRREMFASLDSLAA